MKNRMVFRTIIVCVLSALVNLFMTGNARYWARMRE